MRVLWLLATFVVFVGAGTIKAPSSSEEKVRYDNYSVYKLKIKNKTELAIIEFLQDLSEKYNIWKDYDDVSKEVHLMVIPEEKTFFSELIDIYGIEKEVMVENVQTLIDEEQQTNEEISAYNVAFGWTRYHKLTEIEAWLDEILLNYTAVTEGFVIGKSFEGRDIRGIKISHRPGNPVIFIESNIHAREWVTSATVTWFINQLLTSVDPNVRNLANNYDWHIVPVLNVDGFVYTHEKDRLWRKTRQPVTTSACIGTDPNRNFDSHWMANNGASSNPCSELFAGPMPFSEPEAEALAKYVTSLKDRIKIYLSFHSYGQYLLSPYGHTTEEFPDNYADLVTIGEAFANAIYALPYQTPYKYGSTSTVLYVASGSSVDWVYNTLNVKIGYTIEYRDKGRYGFILPPIQILPNCEELMAGMLALVDKSKELGYI